MSRELSESCVLCLSSCGSRGGAEEIGQFLHGDPEFLDTRVLVAQRDLGIGAVPEKHLCVCVGGNFLAQSGRGGDLGEGLFVADFVGLAAGSQSPPLLIALPLHIRQINAK